MTSDVSIRPIQPQSIGEVLDTSFRLYRLSFSKVWPLGLLLAVASSPTAIYMFLHPMSQADPLNPFAVFGMFRDPAYWLAALAATMIGLCVMGALYLRLNAIGSGEALSNGQALQMALPKVLPMLAMSILYGIAVVVGSVLLIVPGIIVSLSLLLCFVIALLEDRGPLNSLIGSHRLVWGHWWRTSAIMTVAVIIIIVLYVAVGFVVGVAAPLAVDRTDVALFGFVTGQVIGVTANVFVTPYFIALVLAIYWDLKLRKQGGDLAARVGALGTT
jgi:hypothetical protein